MTNFILKAIEESRKVWYVYPRPLDTLDVGRHFDSQAEAESYMDFHEMWDEYGLAHCRVATMQRRVAAHNVRVRRYRSR